MRGLEHDWNSKAARDGRGERQQAHEAAAVIEPMRRDRLHQPLFSKLSA
jgi:hypothetical protein